MVGISEPNNEPEVLTTQRFSSELLADDKALSFEEQAAIKALPSGSALLIVRRGGEVGARFLLDSDITTAGRHPNADIFLDDVTVSRQHAKIARIDGEWTLTDSGSLNGTYVNRNLVTTAVLTNNDEVQIGKYRFVFISNQDQA